MRRSHPSKDKVMAYIPYKHLNVEIDKTLDQMAEATGLNKKTLRNIEKTAMGKVKAALKKRGIRAEDIIPCLEGK